VVVRTIYVPSATDTVVAKYVSGKVLVITYFEPAEKLCEAMLFGTSLEAVLHYDYGLWLKKGHQASGRSCLQDFVNTPRNAYETQGLSRDVETVASMQQQVEVHLSYDGKSQRCPSLASLRKSYTAEKALEVYLRNGCSSVMEL